MTARRMQASWIRIWRCWCGGNAPTIRLIVSGRVQGVKGAEDEVAGFGRRQRRLDRLLVPHLSDQDDVGVLAEGAPQAPGEGFDVPADFALADRAFLVPVEVLDRVFDGDDVVAPASR